MNATYACVLTRVDLNVNDEKISNALLSQSIEHRYCKRIIKGIELKNKIRVITGCPIAYQKLIKYGVTVDNTHYNAIPSMNYFFDANFNKMDCFVFKCETCSSSSFFCTILDVDFDVHLGNLSLHIFEDFPHVFCRRIFSKDGKPTKSVRIITNSKRTYEKLIQHGVFFNNKFYRVEANKFKKQVEIKKICAQNILLEPKKHFIFDVNEFWSEEESSEIKEFVAPNVSLMPKKLENHNLFDENEFWSDQENSSETTTKVLLPKPERLSFDKFEYVSPCDSLKNTKCLSENKEIFLQNDFSYYSGSEHNLSDEIFNNFANKKLATLKLSAIGFKPRVTVVLLDPENKFNNQFYGKILLKMVVEYSQICNKRGDINLFFLNKLYDKFLILYKIYTHVFWFNNEINLSLVDYNDCFLHHDLHCLNNIEMWGNFCIPENVFVPGDDIPQSFMSKEDYETENNVFEIIVTDIYDLSKFWIYFKSSHGPLNRLMDDMQGFYAKNCDAYRIPVSLLEIHLFCVANYLNEYHRVVIVNLMGLEQGFVKVYCIDYGTVCKISKNELWYLTKEFGEFPQQAIRTRLAEIWPPTENTTWSRESAVRFKNLITNRRIFAKVVSVDWDKKILQAYLADTSIEPVKYINEILVEEGYASYTNQVTEGDKCDISSDSSFYENPTLEREIATSSRVKLLSKIKLKRAKSMSDLITRSNDIEMRPQFTQNVAQKVEEKLNKTAMATAKLPMLLLKKLRKSMY